MITLNLSLEIEFDKDDDNLMEAVIDNLKWHLEVEKEVENITDYRIKR